MVDEIPDQHSHLHKVDELADDPPARFSRRQRADDEMDITPMIDMTFLLLIFFLVASRIDASPAVDLPQAQYGIAVPVRDAVFITLDRGVDDTSRVYLGDGMDEATEIKGRNLAAQESQIISYIERELTATTPRKHQVVIKAAKGLKHREVARVLAAVGKVEKVERVHIGVLEGN
jgi:biopolymer transport protein ExbD